MDKQPGIYEEHSFEVDEFDLICGPVCGGKIHSESDFLEAQQQLSFGDIFADESTRAIFMMLLNHVRTTSETISYPYRCDSETHCVYLRAVISKSSTMHVGFVNKVLGYEPRSENARLIRDFNCDNPDFIVCSICNRLEHGRQWMEFQELVEIGIWPANGKVMKCHFGICAECEHAINQRVAETSRSYHTKVA